MADKYTSSREKTKGIELCVSYVLPQSLEHNSEDSF
jgi:hypothetical protein